MTSESKKKSLLKTNMGLTMETLTIQLFVAHWLSTLLIKTLVRGSIHILCDLE